MTAETAAIAPGTALIGRSSEAWIPDALCSCLTHAVGNDGWKGALANRQAMTSLAESYPLRFATGKALAAARRRHGTLYRLWIVQIGVNFIL